MLSIDLPFKGGIGKDVFGGLEMTGVFDSLGVVAITRSDHSNAAE